MRRARGFGSGTGTGSPPRPGKRPLNGSERTGLMGKSRAWPEHGGGSERRTDSAPGGPFPATPSSPLCRSDLRAWQHHFCPRTAG